MERGWGEGSNFRLTLQVDLPLPCRESAKVGAKAVKTKFSNFLLDKTKTTLVKSINLNVFMAL